jgi:hypothetical protein
VPKFTYTGDAGRYYPDLGLEPVPGQEYELDTAPDGRFEPAGTERAAVPEQSTATPEGI